MAAPKRRPVLPPRIRGVLFDLDGTLIRSMEDHYRAWKQALSPFGYALSRQEYFRLEGLPVKEIARQYCELAGAPEVAHEAVMREKERYYLANHRLRFYANAQSVVKMTRRRMIRSAIVTAGLKDRVVRSLPADFLELFDGLVTGDLTARGKPFPDPYLKGLEILGLTPGEAIVVENAPIGIRSAKAAGLFCVAICSTLPKEDLHEADLTIGAIGELKALLS